MDRDGCGPSAVGDGRQRITAEVITRINVLLSANASPFAIERATGASLYVIALVWLESHSTPNGLADLTNCLPSRKAVVPW